MKELLFINHIQEGETITFVPHGLLSIMSHLKNKGIPFEYVDLAILCKDLDAAKHVLCKVYNDNDILCTGISGLITNYRYTRSLIQIIREIAPHQIIIVGGSLGATLPGSLHRDLNADILVDRDGEYVCEAIYNLLSAHQTCSIPGLSQTIQDLPFYFDVLNANVPDYNILDMKMYLNNINKNGRMFSVISGRGCSMNCHFCFKMSGSKMRKKDPGMLVAELQYLKESFGIDRINFDDDNFAISSPWINDFLNGLDKHNFEIQWRFQASLQTLCNFGLIERMQKAGLVGLSIGIESGSKQMLKNMHKAIPIEKAPAIFSQLKTMGLLIHCSFMIGYPGETEESLCETLEFVKQHCDHAKFQVFFYTPYPKTVGYEYCLQTGIIRNEKEYIVNLRNQNSFYVNCTDLKDETLLYYRSLMLSESMEKCKTN